MRQFSEKWKTQSFANRGAILGSIFALSGFLILPLLGDFLFESLFMVLFFPYLTFAFAYGMGDILDGALEKIVAYTSAVALIVIFYALVGAGIGKTISFINKKR